MGSSGFSTGLTFAGLAGLGFPSNRGGLLIDGCILSRIVSCVVGSPPSGIDVAVGNICGLSCCLILGGSFGENLFIDNRGLHLATGVPAAVVVPVDESGDLAAGLSLGREVPTR